MIFAGDELQTAVWGHTLTRPFLMPDATIPAAIDSTAKGPASVSVDGTSVQQQDISKLIEADRYLKGQTAAAKPPFGLRFARLKPPGGGL